MKFKMEMRAEMFLAAIAMIWWGAYVSGELPAYRPFIATIKAQYWTESGKTTERGSTFARRADGSYAVVSEAEVSKGGRGSYISGFNVSRRWSFLTVPFLDVVFVMPIPDPQELSREAASHGSCDGLQGGTWEVKGRSQLSGVDVIEVEVVRTAHEVITEWVAPGLQCFALKRTDVIDGQLRVKEQVLSVEMKEPPESMFLPPPGYKRVTPLELEERYEAEFGSMLWGKEAAERLQQRYERAISESKDR